MVDDLDIYRSAKLLIDHCLVAGDLDGKAVWMRVIRAIKELLDQQPPGSDTPLH